MKTSSFILSALALGAVLLSVSCSGKAGDYCDKVKECQGGNDADRDACVESFKASEDVAGDYDCGDQFSDFADCVVDSSVCKDGRLQADACQAQILAYAACQKAASGKSSVVDTSSGSTSSSGNTSSSSSGGEP